MDQKILLHSGGFGPWFDSKSLAKASTDLPRVYNLVFHVSHNIAQDNYYKDYVEKRNVDDKTIFSLQPVTTTELDELIASATIGIAWYSTEVLGYRATMLGLAAGKIGNYLKCGIPVIVPNYDSFSYVSEYKCGKQISDLHQLSATISEIDDNYLTFSQNARDCYDRLWAPEKYCDALLDAIEGKL